MRSNNSIEPEILFGNRFCTVSRRDAVITLQVFENWTKSVDEIADRYPIAGLNLNVGEHALWLPKVLHRFPNLVELSMFGPSCVRWDLIENLGKLRKLWLRGHIETKAAPININLSQLSSLEFCSITNLGLSWETSAFTTSLRWLRISEIRKLKSLDCSKLIELERLDLWGCPQVRTVNLPKAPKLQEINLNNCPKLELDWRKTGSKLRRIVLNGNIATPLEQIVHAARLEHLWLIGYRLIPPLDFLLELRALKLVDVSGNLTAHNLEIVNKVRSKSKLT